MAKSRLPYPQWPRSGKSHCQWAQHSQFATMMTPPPKTPQDYRVRAAACERLADLATSSETREIMHYLAVRWRALANEDEAKRKLPDNSQAPSRAQPWPSSDGVGTREDRG